MLKILKKISTELLLYLELVYLLEHQQSNTIRIYYIQLLRGYHKVIKTIEEIF